MASVPGGNSGYSIPVANDSLYDDGGGFTGGMSGLSNRELKVGPRSPTLGHDESLSYAAEKFHTSPHMPATDETVTHPRGTGKPAAYAGTEGGKHPDHNGNFQEHLKAIGEARGRPQSLREGVVGRAKSINIENIPAQDSTGPTGKQFTESLHERKPDGKFEESTKRTKPAHERDSD